MTLAPGAYLGPYEVLAPIGKGGMGEVWRGRDTKLDRIVALKVLPAGLADDPERLARFEREAKVLASLNHPNIAQIYGIQNDALVMEYIDGAPLSGPVPTDSALDYARQIVDALEAAHDKSIVHRDLKPANILVTADGVVKVLDFGLAAVMQTGTSADLANSPTLTQSPSMSGMIMGTAAYMAPEQARGRTIDRRADIWALGVVLYELTTGQKLFAGDTTAEVLAEVLKADTDVAKVPPALRPIVERCLRRDPRLRWQAVGDIRIALTEPVPASLPAVSATVKTSRAGWAVAAVIALAALGAGFAYVRQPPARSLEPMRFDVDLGAALSAFAGWIAISPDASAVAFTALRSGTSAVVLRSLNDGNERVLIPSSGNIRSGAFSPDGHSLAFTRVPQLFTVGVEGGAPTRIGEVGNNRGLDWASDGYIYVGQTFGPVTRTPAKGGVPQAIHTIDNSQVRAEQWPQVLPGNRTVLVVSQGPGPLGVTDARPVGITAIDITNRTEKLVVAGAAYGRYFQAPSGIGYLVFVRERSIFAVAFDPRSAQAIGDPVLLGELPSSPGQGAFLDVAGGNNQLLAYLTEGGASPSNYQVVMMDAAGATQSLLAGAATYGAPAFSPNGRTLAYLNAGNIWALDLSTGSVSQRTFGGGVSQEFAWTPDGGHLVYATATQLLSLRADGSGQPVQLQTSDEPMRIYSVSPDARTIALSINVKGVPDLYFLQLDASDADHPKVGTLQPFVTSPEPEGDMRFSPDGHWVAYTARETGQSNIDVFVQHFPPNGGKWRITTGGGRFPTWSRDGHLFYLGTDNRVMTTGWTASGDSFAFGKAASWSNMPVLFTGNIRSLDLHPDGKHLAAFRSVDGTTSARLKAMFLINPAEDIRRRMTTR